MMKEILRNGVLTTEFEAPNLFATYSSGLFTADGFVQLKEISVAQSEGKKAEGVSKKILEDEGKAWTNLNHSVVIVGWGVD